MGFLLRPLKDFSFHSSDISARHPALAHRLIFITFFAVAFTLPIFEAVAATDQTEHDADASLSSPCETKTLDEVPQDPVSRRRQRAP